MDIRDLTTQLINDPSFIRWVKSSGREDNDYWLQWQEKNPQHLEAIEQAQILIQGVRFNQAPVSEKQVDNSWKQVTLQTGNLPLSSSKSFFSAWQYAAVIALLVGSSFAIYFFALQHASAVYETSYGETQTIRLEDGSEVILNGNSQLSIPNGWLDESQRQVELMGEAYFTVSAYHRGGKRIPFMVNTPDLQIKVLGTQFNVNSRRGLTQVVLNEGKVALEIPEVQEALMKPGELVAYSSGNKKITRRQVNPEIYSSWRNDLLILDDTPVSHIIRQLEDSYGVEFILSDESIRNRKISSTGRISAGELETILSAIEALLQVRIVREGNTIELYEN